MNHLVLKDQLLEAFPLEGKTGYTWTLASLLGDMLALAQQRFGPRDLSHTILGVEFCGDHPKIWMPNGRKDLIIQLSTPCKDEPFRACYQLAHECIHTLGPVRGLKPNVLEEGIAQHYSVWYMRERLNRPMWHSSMESYADAQVKAEALLAMDADAIKKLRAEQPVMSLIDEALLLKHYPDLGGLAAKLAAPFVREPAANDEAAGDGAGEQKT
jgi:hypothetical protein